MNRWDIINILIQKINAKKYLEIGIYHRRNYNNIICDYKIGVDPDTNIKCDYHMTSDEFFAQNSECFDIIFIDGLHHSDVVERDINNALNVLEPNGYIICHDMNPDNEETQIVPQRVASWTGDCWKAWVKIRSTNPNLSMFVVDTDCGCGIITRGQQELISLDCELTYSNLEQNRKNWLNLITVEEFKGR
jgi:SAM-dependent methyltransferase